MRTKNPAEEFGVAQYSDGRTGWEPARRPDRAGGRGFNDVPTCRYVLFLLLLLATQCHPVPLLVPH